MCEIYKRFKVQRLIKAVKEQITVTLKLSSSIAIFKLGEMGEAENSEFMNLPNLASHPL